MGRGCLWIQSGEEWNGCLSSTGSVVGTEVSFGYGARSSQPTVGKGKVAPHDHVCPFLVPPHSPVLQPWSIPETPLGPAPILVPAPTQGHLPLPPAFNPPPAPPAPANPGKRVGTKAQVSGPGDGPAAGVMASARNTVGKAWVLPQAAKLGPLARNSGRAGPGRLPGSLPSHHHSSCFLHSSLLWRRESRGSPTPGRAPGPTGQGRAASTGSQRAGAGSAIWGDLFLLLLLPPPDPGTASSPLGGPGLPQFSGISSVTPQPHGLRLRKVSSASQDRGFTVSARGFPLDPGHHPCWWWPTQRPSCPAQSWTLPLQPSRL